MSDFAKVYVINAEWGECSDREQWTVAVHLNRDFAVQHLAELQAAMRAWKALGSDEREALGGDSMCGQYKNALDLVGGFRVMLESQCYWIDEVPVMTTVPDFGIGLRVCGGKDANR